ncbi:tRNA lysidine(34) synthetase TilS [Candidatus Margulisiibacteriota bacterium]
MDKQTFSKISAGINQYNLIPGNTKVLLSFSGGADSVFLLHYLLNSLGSQNIVLVYFNHQLRQKKEMELETDFVISNSKKYKLKSIIKKIPVQQLAANQKISLEASGRVLRYSLLVHYAKLLKIDYIATAHHLDDSCETFMQKIIRGTAANMGGINPKAQLTEKIHLVRPLLFISKKEILSFLEQNKIAFVIDPTNQDLRFTRNKVRHQLMPLIARINPNYQANISNQAEYLREQKDYFNVVLKPVTDKIEFTDNGLELDISEVKELHPFLLKQVLVKLLEITIRRFDKQLPQSKNLVTNQHVNNIYKQVKKHLLSRSVGDKSFLINLPGGLIFNIQDKRLVICQEAEKHKVEFHYPVTEMPGSIVVKEISKLIKFSLIDNNKQNYLSNGNLGYMNFDLLKSKKLYIRNKKEGDKFQPYGSSFQKKIKKYFIDLKIPIGKRDLIPLFFSENNLVWVMGQQTSEKFKITGKTKKVLKIELFNSV